MVYFDDDDFKKMQLSKEDATGEFSRQKRWVQDVQRQEQAKFNTPFSEKTKPLSREERKAARIATKKALNDRLCAIDDELSQKEDAIIPTVMSRSRKARITWRLVQVGLIAFVIYGIYHIRNEPRREIGSASGHTSSTQIYMFPKSQIWDQL